MKKRIFALVTALVLALGLAVTAGADDEPVKELRQADIDSSASAFWQTGNQYHIKDGKYKLMEDIELAQALMIDGSSGDKDVYIDLNGYTLSLKSGVQDSVIYVTGKFSHLYLYDNSAARTGKITGGKGRAVDSIRVGGGICLLGGGTVHMYGGTITGCTASFGGGVYAVNSAGYHGEFYMHGGTITDCTAATSGGGIYAKNINFYMNGGTVTGCTATTSGGAVYLSDIGDALTVFFSNGGTVSGTVYVGKQCWVTPDNEMNDMAHKFNQQTVFDGTVTVNGAIGGGVYKGQVLKGAAGTVEETGAVETAEENGTTEETEAVRLTNGIFWHDRNGRSQIGDGFTMGANNFTATAYIVNYNLDADTLYKRCTALIARNRNNIDSAAVRDIYLAAPDTPTRAGYTFLGWYTAPVGGTKWDFDVDALSQNQLAAGGTDGITLYAQWESDHQHIRRQNTAAATPEAPAADAAVDADTVTSAKTFDAGVALYGAMAVVSLLGMGYVGKKRV